MTTEAAFAYARGEGATKVRRGHPPAAMHAALRLMANAGPCDLIGYQLVWALNDAVSLATVAAEAAKRDVAKEVAPLLDQAASAAQIEHAAHSAAAGRLEQDELAAIIAREKAWWVRLHAHAA